MKTVIFELGSAALSDEARTALTATQLPIFQFIDPSAAGCAWGSNLAEFREALNGRRVEGHWIVAMTCLNGEHSDRERLSQRYVLTSGHRVYTLLHQRCLEHVLATDGAAL